MTKTRHVEEANGATVSTPKKPKHRSPNYPVVGLEKALERAQILLTQAGTQAIPVTLAHKLWDYKEGLGDQNVAALKSFGLLEVTGERDKRTVRLTEDAVRILRNAPDRDRLIEQAALRPAIYKELWDKYGQMLPADTVVENYLVWERPEGKRFLPSSASALIADYRATIAYAKLSVSDKIRETIDGMLEEAAMPEPMTRSEQARQPQGFSSGAARSNTSWSEVAPAGYEHFPLLLRDHKGILRVPSGMPKKEFELLKKQIASTLNMIEATYATDDNEGEE